MVQHAQISAYPCDLPTLQMQEADNVGENLTVAVEVAGGAEEPYVAADAGKVLPDLRQQARRGVPVVVKRVVRERVTDERGEDRAVRHGTLYRKRGLAIHIAVRETAKSERRGKGRRRADLVRGREGIHEIRIDVVTVHQLRGQRDLLLINRIAQLQREILAQREPEPGAGAVRLRLVRHIAGWELLLIE